MVITQVNLRSPAPHLN